MSTRDLAYKIAEYISSIRYKDLDERTIDEVRKRILDSIGVAVGAFHEKPYEIARRIARESVSSRNGSVIWGEGFKSSPEHAAFANSVGVRYLDFNDTYLSKEALHPSDMIPAIIAVAEDRGIDGRQATLAIVIAYEVAARLADAFSVRSVGVDHVTYITIGTAAGIAKLLELSVEKIYNAINLAVNESVSLRQTRSGELSMWKGATAAHSSKKGLFLALLASEDFTGPSPVFEGEFGFFNVVSRQKFDLERFGGLDNEIFKIHETSIKYWPVEYHAMSAVDATLRIRNKVSIEDIESIKVRTFTVCYRIIAKDPEKWDPRTRETADHSLPYIVARALLDGYIWIDSFSNEKILGEDVRKIMRKMIIEIEPEYDKIYPEGIPNTIEIKTRRGETLSETSIHPKGHFKNPMSWSEVVDKFTRLARGKMREESMKTVIDRVRSIDRLRDLRDLTENILISS